MKVLVSAIKSESEIIQNDDCPFEEKKVTDAVTGIVFIVDYFYKGLSTI